MNAAIFFMANFGRFFMSPSSDPWLDVERVLSGQHPLPNGKTSRILKWAIVRTDSSTMGHQLNVRGPIFSSLPQKDAFAQEREAWDGSEPRILLIFSKSLVQSRDVFMSLDRRLVRICTPKGVLDENWTPSVPTATESAIQP